MNDIDNYAFADYRAVMPYTGDDGIYRDDEYALAGGSWTSVSTPMARLVGATCPQTAQRPA